VKQYDVVIVGGGPAGSSSAIALGRLGYKVALIDKSRFPREKLCGDFVNPINRPIFQSLGVEEQLLACNHERVVGFRITSVCGAAAEVALPSAAGADRCGLGMRRADLDNVLIEHAKSHGVAVREECRVRELQRDRKNWRIEIEDVNGMDHLRAGILIGADGRNSRVAYRLGMAGRRTAAGRSIGFQLRLRCDRGLEGNIEIHLFPGGYAGVVGLGGGLINLGFAVERHCWSREPSMTALLDSRLSKNPHLKTILERSEIESEFRSAYPVYFPRRRCFGDAFLLAGDAAQVTEPITGEGVYFAMKTGLLAAEAVDSAYRRGDLSAGQLAMYETTRRRALGTRRGLNTLLRFLVYRPALLDPLIRFSAKRTGLLDSIVHTICEPEAAG
jgi:geranylgeranyl reductase family protein